MARPLERRELLRLVLGDATFDWEPVPTGLEQATGWMHSGIAALADGSLVVAHPEGRQMVRISAMGESALIPTDLTEMHCIVAASHRSGPVLWVADNGHRYLHGAPSYGEMRIAGRLVAVDLSGRVVQELADPQVRGAWSPTSVAVVDPNDPDSDLWVADGYGQSLVHRFASDGTLLRTVGGTASGIRFDCPHGLLVRGTGDSGELYVADRGNRRIAVLDLEGAFRRMVGGHVLDSPSSMADLDGHLLVTELFGAVAVFDGDEYRGHVGSSSREPADVGWPNRVDDDGNIVAPELLQGTFNSPHGITVHDGDVYLTEWCIGGRVVRLRRSASRPGAAGSSRPGAAGSGHEEDH
jgi:hypothetical protein